MSGSSVPQHFVPRKRTGEPIALRRIMVDMIAEYARRNGHADLLRERIDGATGW